MKNKFLVQSLVLLIVIAVFGVNLSAAQEEQTFTVWIPPVFTEAQQNQLDNWAELRGVTLNVEVFPTPFEQNVLARWAAGDRPDLLYFHAIGNWIVQLNPPENLQVLSDEPFVERTVPGILGMSSTYQGEIYAAVLNYPYLDGVFYNKPLFEEWGAEIPAGYDELLALCDTIKANAPDVAPIYIGGGDQWPLQVLPFMLWNDAIIENDSIAKLNTNEIQFTDPVFVDAVAKLKELQDHGCLNEDLLTATFENEQQALMEGRAAMVFQGSWIVGSLIDSYGEEAVNDTVGFFGLSMNSNVVSWQTTGTGAVYAPKTGDPDREALARDFIDWATGEGYQDFLTESQQFPIIQGYDAPEDLPLVLQEANELFLENGAPQFQQTLVASYGAFESYLSEMVSGQTTPEQVMERMNTEFQRSARLLGVPGFE
jgi:raffinose/stachyose/melibiose transport system substrate-binding protein